MCVFFPFCIHLATSSVCESIEPKFVYLYIFTHLHRRTKMYIYMTKIHRTQNKEGMEKRVNKLCRYFVRIFLFVECIITTNKLHFVRIIIVAYICVRESEYTYTYTI